MHDASKYILVPNACTKCGAAVVMKARTFRAPLLCQATVACSRCEPGSKWHRGKAVVVAASTGVI